MILAERLIAIGAPPGQELERWTRAGWISFGVHAAMIALLLSLVPHHRAPATVLTEVHFYERPAPAPAPQTVPGLAGGGAVQGRTAGPKTASSQGAAPLSATPAKEPPRGEPGPRLGAAVPLSGPIVAEDPIGLIGRQTGALRSLPTRMGGDVGAGLKMKEKSDGPQQAPIALGRTDLGALRRAGAGGWGSAITQSAGGDAAGGGAAGAGAGGAKGLRGVGSAAGANVLPIRQAPTAATALKANPLEHESWGDKDGPFSLEGPLKYRKILKMELPPYPRWAEQRALEASVSIRLWVDPQGHVKDNMYLERTSGQTELDRLAMEALKRFVFVPVPDNQSQEDEWGVATFRFELKK